MSRILEESLRFPNGITTEWEPTDPSYELPGGQDRPGDRGTPKEWSLFVRKLNKTAKEQGSYVRYRSVEID